MRVCFLSITPLFLLRFFQNHLLIGVTHALALIPSWRAGTAHIRSDLSDLLLIDHAPISSPFLSASPSHWRNARPRPYTVLAGGNGAHSQRLVRLAAYR